AAKAGAAVATVLGVASDQTVRECIEAGRNYGCRVYVDLLGHPDPAARAQQAEEWGAACVGVHCPIDEQMAGKDPFERLGQAAAAVSIPVAVGGGIHSESAADAVAAGAGVVIVGGFINKAEDAEEATRRIRRAIDTGERIPTSLFKRGGEEKLAE